MWESQICPLLLRLKALDGHTFACCNSPHHDLVAAVFPHHGFRLGRARLVRARGLAWEGGHPVPLPWKREEKHKRAPRSPWARHENLRRIDADLIHSINWIASTTVLLCSTRSLIFLILGLLSTESPVLGGVLICYLLHRRNHMLLLLLLSLI